MWITILYTWDYKERNKMKFKNINKYIYRGHDILENKNSYGVYGDNDELIRIFSKDEATLEDVYKHIDMSKMTERKKYA